MRMNWVLQSGAAAALIALAACSSTTTTTGPGGSGTTGDMGGATTGTAGAGGSMGTGTFTGSKTCNDLLTGNDWDPTLTGSDFDSEDAFNAYDALNTCACVNKMADMGCDDLCKQPDNNTTTNNFCNGVAPLMQCQFCLNGTGTATGITAYCTTEYTACTSN